MDDPNSYVVFFRKTMKMLERSLWPLCKQLYRPMLTYQKGAKKGQFKGLAQIRERDKVIVFPSGARIEFSYLDPLTVEEQWQGSQITAAFIDEFTHIDEYSFNYIRTRLRSPSKHPSSIQVSLNPDSTHFCLKYLDRYIGEDGFAIKEHSGRIAHFINIDGQVITSWSREDLIERYPDQDPISYSFIPSSIEDNPAMTEDNPRYVANLKANDPRNAEQLLKGRLLPLTVVTL